jgi:Collagen triple helix repeat (20 copies)
MLSRVHSKLGTAGLFVAVVALVAALTGAAFAAGGLTKQQEKQVKKIAKKYAGKRGPQGPQGPAGANGAPGAKGDTGARGPEGLEGPEGPRGLEGNPWTAGGVLPSGETETGTWGFGAEPAETGQLVTLSLNIPLAEKPEAIHYLKPGEGETPECPGTVQEPEAAPGQVCIYAVVEEKANFVSVFGERFTTGAAVLFNVQKEGIAFGTWAITAA